MIKVSMFGSIALGREKRSSPVRLPLVHDLDIVNEFWNVMFEYAHPILHHALEMILTEDQGDCR